MEKKEYNICFELGDESHDGHERSEKFHMTSNYSAKEITDFLNEFEFAHEFFLLLVLKVTLKFWNDFVLNELFSSLDSFQTIFDFKAL